MSEVKWRWRSGEMTLGQVRYELDEEMNFCCGQPELVAQGILELLECYEHIGDFDKMLEIFSRPDVVYFYLYQFSAAEWVEHGSSLPGWLTPLGEAVRAALRKFGPAKILAGSLDLDTGEIFNA